MGLLAPIIPWLQVVFAALLVAAILFQQSDESLGSAFGGGGGASGWRTKRGLEKQLFIGTIGLAVLFVLTSLFSLFL